MPYIFMKIKGDKWIHEEYIKDPDAEDDEEDEKKADDWEKIVGEHLWLKEPMS